jgi:bifunctional non-homologous end joining protein LigD
MRGFPFFTRRGNDWAERFHTLVTAAGALNAQAVVLDGEVAVLTLEGRTDFGALQEDLGSDRQDRLSSLAFDILHLETLDLREVRLFDRKRVLAELLKGVHGPIRHSEHLETDGPTMLRNACELQLEGIVSKCCDVHTAPAAMPIG